MNLQMAIYCDINMSISGFITSDDGCVTSKDLILKPSWIKYFNQVLMYLSIKCRKVFIDEPCLSFIVPSTSQEGRLVDEDIKYVFNLQIESILFHYQSKH